MVLLSKDAVDFRRLALQSQERVLALGDAVEELGHLEEYIRTEQPPRHDAICLAVSSLLICFRDGIFRNPSRLCWESIACEKKSEVSCSKKGSLLTKIEASISWWVGF